MKSIRQIYSLLFWGIALIVITLFNSCGPLLDTSDNGYIYLKGDTTKKIEINYSSLGHNITKNVSLPFLEMISFFDNFDQSRLQICDTILPIKAMIINSHQHIDSFEISYIDMNNKNNVVLINDNNGKASTITIDSLLILIKQKCPQSYIERTSENKLKCLTAVPEFRNISPSK